MDLSDIEIGYLVGFIDGEGHVSLHPLRMGDKKYFQANVFIRNTHEPTMHHVRRLLEGADVVVGKMQREDRGPGCKESFSLNVTGMQNVLKLCEVIGPFSVTKSEQWKIVEKWCRSRLASRDSRGYTDQELALAEIGRTMNRRG
jgi:hypothetical protein